MKITFLALSILFCSSLFSQGEIPTWFQGEWSGTIVQNFPTGENEAYTVLIEHKDDYFRITTESFYYKCMGMWQIESSNEFEIIFTQEITAESADNQCASDAKIKIYAKDGVVHYYTAGKKIGECKGILTRDKRTKAEF